MGRHMERAIDLATTAALGVLLIVCGAAGYLFLWPLVPIAVGASFDMLQAAYAKVGITFPILAAFALYLVVMPAWRIVDRVTGCPESFDPRRHLLYVETTAPLVGLLATVLAMARAMQGFDPSRGMLTTSAFLVQHSGEAMWATAIGITEAYVARTLGWVFNLDERGTS